MRLNEHGRKFHRIYGKMQQRAYTIKSEVRKSNGNRHGDGSDEALGMLSMQLIGSAVNGSNAENVAAGFLHALATEHRTLQQQTISVLLRVLKAYGDATRRSPDLYVDLRNETASKLCQQVSDAVEHPYVPLI